jgi:arsenate reductase
MALRALAEIGINAASARSKPAEEFRGVALDLVVTVCDQASEDCPVWLGQGKRVHIRFPDPAKVIGSEAEVMGAFRTVRDSIESKLIPLLKGG